MRFVKDNTAASTAVGFMMIVAFIIISMSIFQAEILPIKNEGIEFDHYSHVQQDMVEFRTAIINTADSKAIESTAVKLGVKYPPRTFFVNKPAPRGRLFTEQINNGSVTAAGADLASICGLGSSVNTDTVRFNTQYNYFSDSEAPPYVYENTVVYREAPDGDIIVETEQAVIEGSTINLFPITTNYSTSGIEAVSVDFEGGETGVKDVSGLTAISIPTDISASKWEKLLSEQANVDSVEQISSSRVRINLKSADWTVKCSPTGLNAKPDANPFTSSSGGDTTGPAITSIGTSEDRVQQGQSFNLTAVLSDFDRGGADISSATWKSNQTISGYTEPVFMSAADGEFDHSNESVIHASIDTNGWTIGTHNLTVRGEDTSSNQGQIAAIAVTIFDLIGRITYVDSSDGTLKSHTADGTTRSYSTIQIKKQGPMAIDITDDGTIDLAYVNNNNDLLVINDSGSKTVLDDSGSVKSYNPRVGDIDSDGTPEVVYIRSGYLYQVEAGGTPTPIRDDSNNKIAAIGIGGIGKYDSDETIELVYVNSNQKLSYWNSDGTITTQSITVSTGTAIGRLADYDDDNELEIPFYDGNNKGIDIANDSSIEQSFDPSYAVAASSFGKFNYTGDQTPEVIHVDADTTKIRYLNTSTGETGRVGSDTAKTGKGIA